MSSSAKGCDALTDPANQATTSNKVFRMSLIVLLTAFEFAKKISRRCATGECTGPERAYQRMALALRRES